VRLLQAVAGAVPPGLAVVVAFRSEEVDDGSPLRHLERAQSLHLGPLSPTAVGALAASMAGPLPDRVVDTVVRLADGSPFMAAAVLRGLVESGALTGSAHGWTVDDDALADVQAAGARQPARPAPRAAARRGAAAAVGRRRARQVLRRGRRRAALRRARGRCGCPGRRPATPAAVGRRAHRPVQLQPRQDP
jgi:hypothetical protein